MRHGFKPVFIKLCMLGFLTFATQLMAAGYTEFDYQGPAHLMDASGRVVVAARTYLDEDLRVIRLTPAGHPDPTFGNQGSVSVGYFDSGFHGLYAHREGYLIAGGCENAFVCLKRLTGDGRIDRNFGSSGTLVLDSTLEEVDPNGTYRFNFDTLEVMNDGSLLVAIEAWGYDLEDPSALRIVKVTEAGRIDEAFGDRGVASILNERSLGSFSVTSFEPESGLLTVFSLLPERPDMLSINVVRLNGQTGSMDPTFGTQGAVPIFNGVGARNGSPRSAVRLADGGYLFFAQIGWPFGAVGVIKVLPSGRIDDQYGTHGLLLASRVAGLSDCQVGIPEVNGDSIFLPASTDPSASPGGGASSPSASVMRLGLNGQIDSTFGINGIANLTKEFSESAWTTCNQLSRQCHQSWYVHTTEGYDIIISRLNFDGSPDVNYGVNGKAIIPIR